MDNNAKVYGGVYETPNTTYVKVLDHVVGIIGQRYAVLDASPVISGAIHNDQFKHAWHKLIDHVFIDMETRKTPGKQVWGLYYNGQWHETNEYGLVYVEL